MLSILLNTLKARHFMLSHILSSPQLYPMVCTHMTSEMMRLPKLFALPVYHIIGHMRDTVPMAYDADGDANHYTNRYRYLIWKLAGSDHTD